MLAHSLTPAPSLVVGPCDTPADVKALRALAHAVAYETGLPATWATDSAHDVRDFGALYVTIDWASSLSSAVLAMEALSAGVDVHEPLSADEVATCVCGLVGRHTRISLDEDGEPLCHLCAADDSCAWCFESAELEEDATFVEQGQTVYPMHVGCAERVRATSERVLSLV